MKLTILTALLALTGCPGGKTCDTGDSGTCGDSGTPSDTDTDTDTDTDADLSFNASWAASGVTLSITNGSGTYLFGMAEEVENGWYGEDGYEGEGPNSGAWDINHDGVSATGITLSTVTTPGAVVANSTTLLTNTIAEAGHLAYMLYDNDSMECWEKNDDAAVDYYGCM
ncbi:hypothetical protein LBMAG42_12350 [Deltaproteobacteria bacterium]|nr:hypothetical protein LBMAG42_12350 [Deltaproteobacteria bacterium]